MRVREGGQWGEYCVGERKGEERAGIVWECGNMGIWECEMWECRNVEMWECGSVGV